MHWSSREYSTSTEPRLVDSETVVHVFLESINCVLLMTCVQPALINIGSTCSSVVYRYGTAVCGREPPRSGALRLETAQLLRGFVDLKKNPALSQYRLLHLTAQS